MIFRQIFDSNSFTYTYLISSGIGREALIIDPVLEKVDQYIKLLKELDLKLVKVIDTHIHVELLFLVGRLVDHHGRGGSWPGESGFNDEA